MYLMFTLKKRDVSYSFILYDDYNSICVIMHGLHIGLQLLKHAAMMKRHQTLRTGHRITSIGTWWGKPSADAELPFGYLT